MTPRTKPMGCRTASAPAIVAGTKSESVTRGFFSRQPVVRQVLRVYKPGRTRTVHRRRVVTRLRAFRRSRHKVRDPEPAIAGGAS